MTDPFGLMPLITPASIDLLADEIHTMFLDMVRRSSVPALLLDPRIVIRPIDDLGPELGKEETLTPDALRRACSDGSAEADGQAARLRPRFNAEGGFNDG